MGIYQGCGPTWILVWKQEVGGGWGSLGVQYVYLTLHCVKVHNLPFTFLRLSTEGDNSTNSWQYFICHTPCLSVRTLLLYCGTLTHLSISQGHGMVIAIFIWIWWLKSVTNKSFTITKSAHTQLAMAGYPQKRHYTLNSVIAVLAI